MLNLAAQDGKTLEQLTADEYNYYLVRAIKGIYPQAKEIRNYIDLEIE